MKKVLLLLLCFLFWWILPSCSLMGLTVDQAKQNLEDAMYNVTIINGDDYLDSDECLFKTIVYGELDKYLYAEKGEEKIYMFFFYSTNIADFNYNTMSIKGLSSGRNNNIVYFGTKQAIKDSNI